MLSRLRYKERQSFKLITSRDRFLQRQPARKFELAVVSTVQSAIHSMHILSGLPWWQTFIATTVAVRCGLFPIVRLHFITSRRLSSSFPELSSLYKLLVQRLESSGELGEKIRTLSIFFKGVKACLSLNNTSFQAIVAYPILNIGLFITFVYSLRNMMKDTKFSGLQEGGTLWFENLSIKDKTCILPLSALSISYLGLEVSFYGKVALTVLLKDLFQSLLILSIPFVISLPCGVFMYWIPSSMLGIAGHFALRNSWMQKILRIPSTIAPK